jgi:hypothetical protein
MIVSGCDNGDGVQYRRKQAMEPDEKQSIGYRNFGFEGARLRSTFN